MHLLPRDLHTLDDAGAAIDLGQSPADIVFLSFSDSELRLLARLHEKDAATLPSLRCASLAQLKHPYSVDLYLDSVIRRAKLVVVRLLGGKDYWAYGVEQLETLARANRIALAIIPGDRVDDMRLAQASSLDAQALLRIWRFFQDGGPDNLRSFLGYAATLAGWDADWRESVAVANAGHFEIARRNAPLSAPRATIIFYRSLFLADDVAPILALADALCARGFAVDPIYVASLKDRETESFVAQALDDFSPDVVLNATAFSARRDKSGSVLDRADAPVLQVALATFARSAWENSARGANGADLAMNVVLPEIDGRIFTRAISFKEEAPIRGAAEFNETRHAPEVSRIAFVADLAANWARLRRKPNARKSLALILSNYPARRGRGGYAIGLDAESSVHEILDALNEAEYSLVDFPQTLRSDVGAIRNTPQDTQLLRRFDSRRELPGNLIRALEDSVYTVSFPISSYRELLAQLSRSFVDSINDAWGEPQDDPVVTDGAFRLSCIVAGNLVIALQPDRGARTDRHATYHDMNLAPRHAFVAFYLWLRYVRNIDAMIHLGAHGALEWLPGKSVMLSETCAPEAVLGPTPLVYPFIVNDPGEAAHAKRRAGAITIGHLTPPLVETELFDTAARIETLLDEYSTAMTLDPRRARLVADAILDEGDRSGLAQECGATREQDISETLTRLDAWLCDLKETRIGDGLHIFGRADADPARDACARAERQALIAALAGRFVEPGPGGAPSRGRADVLPTGRNIFCVDPRCAPSQIAFEIGRRAAEEVMTRYAQTHGEFPRRVMLDLWGSAAIRTGGEDFAQALALLGVKPRWDMASARVIGFEILPQARLEFPRVDVTLHISGLFRDLFPNLIALFDDAVRAVAALDEDAEFNPLKEAADLSRIFGAAEGTYGLGVSDRVVRGEWTNRDDLARTFLAAAGHKFDRSGDSAPALDAFTAQVANANAHVHVQDMAEADVLTGPAFADFEGGFAAANAMLGGSAELLHLNATRPEHLRLRTLKDEIARVLRMRLANPRWLAGQMRHGHRGAGEIAEAIDNLFAFAATSGLVSDAQFDLAFAATLGEEDLRDFLARENPLALNAITSAFDEAIKRDIWRTRRNSVLVALDGVGALDAASV